MIVLVRLRLSLTTLPDIQGWLLTLGVTLIFAGLSVYILKVTALFKLEQARFGVGQYLLIGAIAFVSPSLVEELGYRAVLLPHPLEQAGILEQVGWAGFSLTLFVLAHPLIARFIWPWSRPMFYRASFLLIVLLLGVACTLAYLCTGSVWSPVAIHWLTIVVWKSYFGGPDFGLSKTKS